MKRSEELLCTGLIILSIIVVKSLADLRCINIFEHEEYSGKSKQICDCGEKCLNLEADWRNSISSIKSNITSNVQLFSGENCSGDELKLGVGSNGKLKEFNDKAKSLKISGGEICII